MSKIENYNCEGMCLEKFCSNKATEFINLEFLGINLHLIFCKEHENIFLENYLNMKSGFLRCSECGGETFKISQNPYSKIILKDRHIELICEKCNHGNILVLPKEIPKQFLKSEKYRK